MPEELPGAALWQREVFYFAENAAPGQTKAEVPGRRRFKENVRQPSWACKREALYFSYQNEEEHSMKYIVETRGLSKSYGEKQVVRDVDLKVPKG